MGQGQGDLFGGARITPPDAPTPLVRVGELHPAPADKETPAPARQVLTVGELTRRLKGVLEGQFARVWVRGEVSGFRGPHARGHLYFSLKDAEACVDVKIWASTAQRLKFRLQDGMELLVEGSLDVYAPQGRYSLIGSRAEPVGEGALALAFVQLKEKLTAEGLMGERRVRPPRPLPFWPRRIGVVTSKTGAALRDFLRVLHQRNPKVQVLLCDARVQGEGAASEVVSALARLARTNVDVIVVTRGGGSVEDLWTFNEERVARAIWASPVPVVSAIGHEVDFTIADFVADHRAPTPTAAAALVAPVLADLELGLAATRGRLRKAVWVHLLEAQERWARLSARLGDPRRRIGEHRLRLGESEDALARAMRARLKRHVDRHRALVERLGRMRPEARLGRDRRELAQLDARLEAAMRQRVHVDRKALGKVREALLGASPTRRLDDQRLVLGRRHAQLREAVHRFLHQSKERFAIAVAGLHALSPLAVMSRGYSVVFRERTGEVVRSGSQVERGEGLRVWLGVLGATQLSQGDQLYVVVQDVVPGLPGKGSDGGNDGAV